MQHQFAEVVRVHAVGILGRVDHVDDRVLVDALGQRQLDDEPGASQDYISFALTKKACHGDSNHTTYATRRSRPERRPVVRDHRMRSHLPR